MSTLPRLLVLMGSGETSPTMTKTHRTVLAALGRDARAVLLDTPAGFQENVGTISARAVDYFAESANHTVTVASLRRADDARRDPLAWETALADLRRADWVFAGPGSPTYALAQWRDTPVVTLLRDKLRNGGAVILSSAAACTAGRRCVPVYEIYKVGQEPHWLEGMDLLCEVGLEATVIPHFDNAEGGNHDTRFCYLGERRLVQLEAELDDDELLLGIDEHTAAVFDLDAGTMTVTGNGSVTLRRHGSSHVLPTGTTVPVGGLAGSIATDGSAMTATATATAVTTSVAPDEQAGIDPVAVAVTTAREDFDRSVEARDASGAVAALLALDTAIADWSRDPTQSAERHAALLDAASLRRTLVVELGSLASRGTRDPRDAVAPFVDAMLALRAAARADKRWADSDAIRDALLGAGVELRDGPGGTEWLLPEA